MRSHFVIRRSSCLLLLLAFAAACPAAAGTATFQAGVFDAFALPAETASPSAEIAALTPTQDFDLIAGVNGGTINTNVVHTFTGLPAAIVGGTLELRVRGGDPSGIGGVETDGIVLLFVDAMTATLADGLAFSRTFGPFSGGGLFDPDAGLVQATPWSNGDDATLLLDLSALPLAAGGTLNLIPQIASRGFLDVLVGDETGADAITLTLQTQTVPASPTWALALLAGALLATVVSLTRRAARTR